jgi:hypothetical protein
MSSYLRKCVSMGPAGVISPGTGQPQDFRYHSPSGQYGTYDNGFFIADTGTRWMKLWVDLPTVWPTSSYVNAGALDTIDYQIAFARAYGCHIILTFNGRLPSWITGSSDPSALPNPTGSGCPWQVAVNAFFLRYHPANTNRPYGGWSLIDFLEPLNEPNWIFSPQSAVVGTVATLMSRAKEVAAAYYQPGVAAVGLLMPCVHDNDGQTGGAAGKIDYHTFTDGVLAGLALNGYYGIGEANSAGIDATIGWSMHNYNDCIYDQGSGTLCPSSYRYFPGDPNFDRSVLRSQRVKAMLDAHGWRGWTDGTTTGVFITEGGEDLHRLQSVWGWNEADSKNGQAYLMQRNFGRLANDTSGWGIPLATNYLFYSDDRYNPVTGTYVFGDTGLLDDPITTDGGTSDDGQARAATYATWKSFGSLV